MASNTEPTVNTCLAQSLRRLHPKWYGDRAIVSQATRTLRGKRADQPDILVAVAGACPLVIEAEFEPARCLDADALSRIGQSLASGHGPVETVLALRYPARLRDVPEALLAAELAAAEDLRWCVWTEGPDEVRYPSQGWIEGSLKDFAGTVETAAVSQRQIDSAADELQAAVSEAAVMLSAAGQAAQDKTAQRLHQASGEQTMRMAASIVANAFLFQISVASAHGTPGIDETRLASGDPRRLHKADVLDAWAEILKVDYWPIFDIAASLLLPLAEPIAENLCEVLAASAGRLASTGAAGVQDLSGQMFGRLIADRKFLATFYTLPASAALLAELAVSRLDGRVDWADEDAVTSLRAADLACGTGALLSAVYRRIAARVRRSGLDDADLHCAMIERVLIGADIMPAAAHLTTTMLSSVHPEVGFGKCGVHVLPFGRSRRGGVALGALDLLGDAGTASLLGRPGTRLAGRAAELEAGDEAVCNVADRSLDICIMNPPFTRPTNHERAQAAGVPVPSFAGFGTTEADQLEMAKRLKALNARLSAGERAGNGNAGLASNFVDLAHAKLRPGGVLALILPFSAASGKAWRRMRSLLDRHYDDMAVVSIAAHGSTERSFSADTGMAEMMLVAVKRLEPDPAGGSAVRWSSLPKRPSKTIEAVEAARAVHACRPAVIFESLEVGGDSIGMAFVGKVSDGGMAGIRGASVVQTAAGLADGLLTLPRCGGLKVPAISLSQIGVAGPVHRDVNGIDQLSGRPRGPFEVKPIRPDKTISYPILWRHDAGSGRESRLVVAPDSEGWPRDGMRRQAIAVWRTSTRLHISLDFRINSQPLAACISSEACIGGRAWPSFRLSEEAWEIVVALWLNTTLGLVGFWWTGTRQHQGRANLTVSRLGELPSIDPRRLSAAQLSRAGEVFEAFKDRPLLPANEAYRDPVRHDLDAAVLCNVLGISEEVLTPLAMMRSQWCEEPSVHGGKSTRPRPVEPG